MAYEFIRVEAGAVARVILNRPEAKNAMGAQTLGEIKEAFETLSCGADLRCVIVTAEGKDFCAGADIEWMKAGGLLRGEEAKKDARRFADMLRAIDQCPVPVIVGAHGAVFGGGLGILAAADVGILSDDAKLCFSETKLGIMPSVISSWVLPKIGAAQARRWYLTAEIFTPAQAVTMGLAQEVVPAAELSARVQAVAASILRNGPIAVRTAKSMISKILAADPSQRVEMTIDTLVKLRSSPEGQEGLGAFLERRAPEWTAKP